MRKDPLLDSHRPLSRGIDRMKSEGLYHRRLRRKTSNLFEKNYYISLKFNIVTTLAPPNNHKREMRLLSLEGHGCTIRILIWTAHQSPIKIRSNLVTEGMRKNYREKPLPHSRSINYAWRLFSQPPAKASPAPLASVMRCKVPAR